MIDLPFQETRYDWHHNYLDTISQRETQCVYKLNLLRLVPQVAPVVVT